ncbi:MAG: hypothetical protein WC764_01455 [Candidatus Paceibacterota bacterium]|jgi:hypothetical protein
MLRKLVQSVFNGFCGIFPGVAFRSVADIQEEVRNAGEKLKMEIVQINSAREKEAGSANEKWQKNLAELRYHIHIGDDPSKFISWPVIQRTMFCSSSVCELHELQKNQNWLNVYKHALSESPVGNPPHYPWYPWTSGNTVHHLYNLSQLLDRTDFNLARCNSIIEFGGGYGNTCRILYRMGYTNRYVLYDLPEFSALQGFYLGVNKLLKDNRIELVSSETELTSTAQKDLGLLIALWSLSEAPLEVRDTFMKVIGHPEYILVAYQEQFGGIKNREYFDEFKKKLGAYIWTEYPITHAKGQWYLVGKRLT